MDDRLCYDIVYVVIRPFRAYLGPIPWLCGILGVCWGPTEGLLLQL